MKTLSKFMYALSLGALFLTGCSEDKFASSGLPDGLQQVSFTASMAEAVTKPVSDPDPTPTTSVNRCIMEIYYNDVLFDRMITPVSGGKASFMLSLVSNRTYKVAFWADYVSNAMSESGLSEDLYYTTNAKDANNNYLGLQAVALKGTYSGNDDKRDAFFYCGDYTVGQAGGNFSATLKRPFAQINVITNDVATAKKAASGAVPDGVKVNIKQAATTFDVLKGTIVSGSEADLVYTGSLYGWEASNSECTLSMDYVFASQDKALIDVDWKAYKAGNDTVVHAFSSVPYQRNYRTNIKGGLLTTIGKYDLTMSPSWESPDYDVTLATVPNPDGVKSALQAKAGDSSSNGLDAVVTVSEFPSDAQEDYKLEIPAAINDANTPGITFNATGVPSGKTLVVTDETFSSAPQNGFGGKVVLITDAQTVRVETTQAHVELVGNADVVYASTSQTTFVVSKGYTVGTLNVLKGNVAVKGTVTDVVRDAGNPDAVTYVDVYGGGEWTKENDQVSATLVARHPTLAIGEEVFIDLQQAFDAANNGDSIKLVNNAEVFSTATLGKAISVYLDLAGYTMTVRNDNGDGIVVTGGATLNLTNSDNQQKGVYQFYTDITNYDGIFVYNDQEGKTTTLNIMNPVKIVCEASGANNPSNPNSAVHTEAVKGNAVFNLYEGTEFRVNTTSVDQIAAVQIGRNSVFNMTGGTFDVNAEFGSFSYGNDAVGVVLWGTPSGSNAVNISGGSFTVGGKNAFAQGVQIGSNNGSNVNNKVTISGGEFNLSDNPGGKSYAMTMYVNGTYEITGGTFKRAKSLNDDSDLFAFNSPASNRQICIKGGQFFKEPDSSYIPEGYEASQVDDYWVVNPKKN